ncbi:MAG: hypothetical protein JW943_13325 [Deltaproteobacteria bacterium]|nr:hypothetical protein [Deltaproteobacteria bacterium]
MIESALNKIADRILDLDEASLAGLWGKYKDRMEHFDTSKEWEKAVVIFFIINSVRVKNHIFNEQIMNAGNRKTEAPKAPKASSKGKAKLKLVK